MHCCFSHNLFCQFWNPRVCPIFVVCWADYHNDCLWGCSDVTGKALPPKRTTVHRGNPSFVLKTSASVSACLWIICCLVISLKALSPSSGQVWMFHLRQLKPCWLRFQSFTNQVFFANLKWFSSLKAFVPYRWDTVPLYSCYMLLILVSHAVQDACCWCFCTLCDLHVLVFFVVCYLSSYSCHYPHYLSIM